MGPANFKPSLSLGRPSKLFQVVEHMLSQLQPPICKLRAR
jgi:hypothetical protein